MTIPLIPAGDDDRTDDKWAHPLLKDRWMNAGSAEAISALTDPSQSVEEVVDLRNWIHEKSIELFNMNFKEEEHKTGEWREYWAPGLELEENAPQVRIKIRVPIRHDDKPLPAEFFVYGGALIMGCPEMFVGELVTDFEKLGAVVVCAQYREAPECKYPAAINDLHAAYKWMIENAGMLGIDLDRIVVRGESSGGHLAAALMHRLKRFNYINGIMPRAQVLVVPCIDDRQLTPSSKITIEENYDSVNSHKCWLAWLGYDNFASSRVGPEGVPGHAEGDDFKGLPPAYIHVMESDPDRDDVIRYASGLLAVGVFCELHQWGGTNHTSLIIYPSAIRDRYLSLLMAELEDAITYDLRRPWLK